MLSAKLIATVDTFEIASTIRLLLNSMMITEALSKIPAGPKRIFEGIVDINYTTEKFLMIDFTMPRQVCKVMVIAKAVRLPSGHNIADGLKGKNLYFLLREWWEKISEHIAEAMR